MSASTRVGGTQVGGTQVGGTQLGGFTRQLPDSDALLTSEWVDSLDALVDAHGPAAARLVLARLLHRAGERDVGYPTSVSTPYVNTISPVKEPAYPGDPHLEARIEAFVRWNAAVMVTRANILSEGIGGHMSTPASSTSLYEVGFNHFFRGRDANNADDWQAGDQVFFQGHATPGIYARAFLEGRLSEAQVDRFRREIGGGGLSSYPHPRLMPEFWEFPTVSMGLGPLNAIHWPVGLPRRSSPPLRDRRAAPGGGHPDRPVGDRRRQGRRGCRRHCPVRPRSRGHRTQTGVTQITMTLPPQ